MRDGVFPMGRDPGRSSTGRRNGGLRRYFASAVVALVLSSGACGGEGPEGASGDGATPSAGPARPASVVVADDGNFERLTSSSNEPMLVLFWAPWSGPDRIVLRYLDDVAAERPELRVVKVDVDRAPKTASRFDVMSIPTAMVLVGGRRHGQPVVGALPRKRWERELDLDRVAPRG